MDTGGPRSPLTSGSLRFLRTLKIAEEGELCLQKLSRLKIPALPRTGLGICETFPGEATFDLCLPGQIRVFQTHSGNEKGFQMGECQ